MERLSKRVNGQTRKHVDHKPRLNDRSRKFQPVGLRIEAEQSHASIYRAPDYGRAAPHQVMDAQLVDVSKGGLGVETFAPLPLATVVVVRGELHSPGYCFEFRSRAWVVHCLAREDGCFRIGLNFSSVDARELACEHGPNNCLEPFV